MVWKNLHKYDRNKWLKQVKVTDRRHGPRLEDDKDIWLERKLIKEATNWSGLWSSAKMVKDAWSKGTEDKYRLKMHILINVVEITKKVFVIKYISKKRRVWGC